MKKGILTIERLSFGGAGFGHLDGKACFIPFTAPGDVVRVKVVEEKSSFVKGTVEEIVSRSATRTNPPCPIFGTCGGCQWQHLPYHEQCAQKHQIFTGIMARIGRVDIECIEPVVMSPQPYEYRSRVQLKIRHVGGKPHVGFYRGGSHFVVNVPSSCAISSPPVNRLIEQIQTLMLRFPEPDKVPQIDISTGDDGKSIVIVHYIGSNSDSICRFLTSEGVLSADGVWFQMGRKSTIHRVRGEERLSYRVPACSGEIELCFSRGGFSQVNFAQNRVLVETATEWSELTGGERVLDLYCGNGNVSLPLAQSARQILGIEEYAPSLDDAAENARKNDICNATFLCSDVAAGVRKLSASGEVFDVVILDPPRSGAKEAVPLIASLKPRTIIYISCDPPTLARDIAILRKHGYELVKSRPIDMFPQTYHLESINLLKPLPPGKEA